MTPYLICKFEKQTLSNLIKECFGSHFPHVYNKAQIAYIFRYLNDMKCKSVLLEPTYIDRDYLEDYNHYYVKGFNNKGFKTARLHFFSKQINHKMIDNILRKNNSKSVIDELKKNYLGFMVVKPLPKTFIGKTCLRPYDSLIQSPFKKTLLREYTVDLFGISLTVDSVAFQEQDMIVSAYATTALWSALHASKHRDLSTIPSCSEITINAINYIPGSNNSFPNLSLTNKQLLRSIDVEKFKHHLFKVDEISDEEFHQLVETHINSNIPLILRGTIYEVKDDKTFIRKNDHAVTILGYNSNEGKALYIHNDRQGPFVRSRYLKSKITETTEWGLTFQEKDDLKKWKKAHEVLVPDSIIVLTKSKVRLSSEYAYTTAKLIKYLFETLLKINNIERTLQLSFSIKLKEISEIRSDVLNFNFQKMGNDKFGIDYCENKRIEFLTHAYSKHHWIVEFKLDEAYCFDVLFDATDIPQGDAVSGIIYKDYIRSQAVIEILLQLTKNDDTLELILKDIPNFEEKSFLISFLNKLSNDDDDYSTYLDNFYGTLRAPSYLKPEEFNSKKINKNKSSKSFYGRQDLTFSALTKNLENNNKKSFLIWAITQEGTLVIGKEINNNGHPTLTGFKPARIAGELFIKNDQYFINSKSGRYSGDYDDPEKYLVNVIRKFKEVFPDDINIKIDSFIA